MHAYSKTGVTYRALKTNACTQFSPEHADDCCPCSVLSVNEKACQPKALGCRCVKSCLCVQGQQCCRDFRRHAATAVLCLHEQRILQQLQLFIGAAAATVQCVLRGSSACAVARRTAAPAAWLLLSRLRRRCTVPASNKGFQDMNKLSLPTLPSVANTNTTATLLPALGDKHACDGVKCQRAKTASARALSVRQQGAGHAPAVDQACKTHG